MSEAIEDLLEYCLETGEFIWKVDRYGGARKGDKAGCRHPVSGYWVIRIKGKQYKGHRLAWYLVHGSWPKEIDHINRDKTDNRLANLREVTREINCRNRPRQYNNISGFNGVHWAKNEKKWRAQIRVKGRTVSLGYFEHLIDAVFTRIREEKKQGYHSNHGKKL